MEYLAFNSNKKSSKAQLFKWMILPLFFLVFSVFPSFSQQVREYNEFLETLGSSEQQDLKNLFSGGAPQIYVSQSKVKTFGDGDPRVIFMEPNSAESLANLSEGVSSVEGISIHFSSENNPSNFRLSTAQTSRLTALKYILVLSDSPISQATVQNMFTGFAESEVLILYQYSEPQ
jgi:hypothetical protein